ncbi:hypothetical protein MMC18_007813 [Xylographa bjoerkii]|nr:hypothetical protein [Xylographa bjoerkii]
MSASIKPDRLTTVTSPLLKDPQSVPPLTTRSKAPKKEGDISSVFVSLSGAAPTQLPDRFADIKQQLISGHEDAVRASWQRLLERLVIENAEIAQKGPAVVPQIDFSNLDNPSQEFLREVKKRGVAVVRSVVPQSEARGYKAEVEKYIKANPWTKGMVALMFLPVCKTFFELYWSPSQVRARAHPNLISAQRFLMKLWHSDDMEALISTSQPLAYADRVRIRQPGDSGFALGPHIDGGSLERWEPEGYGLGGVYDKIWQGEWEKYDPWEASSRIPAVSDLYDGAGACSMFRMFQGWLSMSSTGPKEGTLMVNPLLQLSTAYLLLRPFFTPIKQLESSTSTIHAVDKVHEGESDSSVLYIPVCPITQTNAEYLARQRDAFLSGHPGPDFPGGKGESEHFGRPTLDYLSKHGQTGGLQAMGLEKLSAVNGQDMVGGRRAIQEANSALAFDAICINWPVVGLLGSIAQLVLCADSEKLLHDARAKALIEHPVHQLVASADSEFEAVQKKQPKDLAGAAKEYKTRYKTCPPQHFDEWYAFATKREVQLIYEFDGIFYSLLPFWGLEPSVIRERTREALGREDNFFLGISIRDSQSRTTGKGQGWHEVNETVDLGFQADGILGLIENVAKWLPDMDLAFNSHDEPRVIVPHGDLEVLLETARKNTHSVKPIKNDFSKSPADMGSGES